MDPLRPGSACPSALGPTSVNELKLLGHRLIWGKNEQGPSTSAWARSRAGPPTCLALSKPSSSPLRRTGPLLESARNMPLYSAAPPVQTWPQVKPSLLMCWWTTIFSIFIIFLRLSGRLIRTERLFTEDLIVAAAIVPMLLRIGCLQFIIMHGTNNADVAAAVPPLSPHDLHQRSVASGLVILSRILCAATLWTLKAAVLEFFRRLTVNAWTRSYETTLFIIRVTLVVTFIATLISTLTECHPFSHYWQVFPDPGPACRQGFVQILTAGASNVLTDLLLVIFPIPFALRSALPLRRKAQIILFFTFSLAPVAMTFYRVPRVILAAGNQPYRSLLASVEILFATAAANSLALGSFIRDLGPKKAKFDPNLCFPSELLANNDHRSPAEAGAGAAAAPENLALVLAAPAPLPLASCPPYRKSAILRHWGSDHSLVRELGMGVSRYLREIPDHLDQPDEIPVIVFTSQAAIARRDDNQPSTTASLHSPSSCSQPLSLLTAPTSQLSPPAANTITPLVSPAFDNAIPQYVHHSSPAMMPRTVSFYDVGCLLKQPDVDDPPSSPKVPSPTLKPVSDCDLPALPDVVHESRANPGSRVSSKPHTRPGTRRRIR